MREFEEPAGQAYLTRSEVELELARIALTVMRVTPDAFAEVGRGGAEAGEEALASRCTRLLARAAPEHRPFVEDRLLQLARSLAGGRSDAGFEWLDVGLSGPGGRPRRSEGDRSRR